MLCELKFKQRGYYKKKVRRVRKDNRWFARELFRALQKLAGHREGLVEVEDLGDSKQKSNGRHQVAARLHSQC